MSSSASTASTPFGQYEMHGFQPDPTLSDDENLMTMCMLVTRNSICTQGHMGCILLGKSPGQSDSDQEAHGDDKAAGATNSAPQHEEQLLHQRIIGVATNQPLYSELDSDVHAEIGAIGDAARCGNRTDGCTAYITMPPCKNCFGALISAGCKRIVSPRPPSAIVEAAAKARSVEVVPMDSDVIDRIKARIDILINEDCGDDDVEKRKADIAAKRKARKEASKLKKEKRRLVAEENTRIHGVGREN